MPSRPRASEGGAALAVGACEEQDSELEIEKEPQAQRQKRSCKRGLNKLCSMISEPMSLLSTACVYVLKLTNPIDQTSSPK